MCIHSTLLQGHIHRFSRSYGVICNFIFLLCLHSSPLVITVNGLYKDTQSPNRDNWEYNWLLSFLIIPYIPTPLLLILDMHSLSFLISIFFSLSPRFFFLPETPPHPSVIMAWGEVVKFMTFRSSGAHWWRTRIVSRDPSGISLSLMSKLYNVSACDNLTLAICSREREREEISFVAFGYGRLDASAVPVSAQQPHNCTDQ